MGYVFFLHMLAELLKTHMKHERKHFMVYTGLYMQYVKIASFENLKNL